MSESTLPRSPARVPWTAPTRRAGGAAVALTAILWLAPAGVIAAEPVRPMAQAAPTAPLAAPAFGAPLRVRPGLWESRVEVQTGDPLTDALLADAQARVAGLPPEQRQALEQMMAARGLALGAQPNTLRSCISAEQAAGDELPQALGPCRALQTARSGNTLRLRFVCAMEPPLRGEGEVTLQSPTAYSSLSSVTTAVMGAPRQVLLRSTGRWLADDCGATAPR